MEMDIIMTPQTQAGDLLAFPDLYHELALCCLSAEVHSGSPASWLNPQVLCQFTPKGRQQGLQEASLKSMAEIIRCGLGPGMWSPRATRLRPFGVGRRTGGRTSG